MAGNDYLVMRVKNKDFKVSAGSFSKQTLMAPVYLVDTVKEAVVTVWQPVSFGCFLRGGFVFLHFLQKALNRSLALNLPLLHVMTLLLIWMFMTMSHSIRAKPNS